MVATMVRLGGKFYRTKFVFMYFIGNIAVIYSVFTAAIVVEVKAFYLTTVERL